MHFDAKVWTQSEDDPQEHTDAPPASVKSRLLNGQRALSWAYSRHAVFGRLSTTGAQVNIEFAAPYAFVALMAVKQGSCIVSSDDGNVDCAAGSVRTALLGTAITIEYAADTIAYLCLVPSLGVRPTPVNRFMHQDTSGSASGIASLIDAALTFDALGTRDLVDVLAQNIALFTHEMLTIDDGSGELGKEGDLRLLRRIVAQRSHDPQFDVTELVRVASLSRRTVERAFGRLGTSPARYIVRVRLDAATFELGTSNLPLAEVAKRNGFGSVQSLRRALSKKGAPQ